MPNGGPANCSESIHQEECPKDEWVKAWIKGNVLLPQINLGISTLTLASLLEEDELNIRKFRSSNLSTPQMTRVLRIARANHETQNIRGCTNAVLSNGVQNGPVVSVVNENRINRMWSFITKNLSEILDHFQRKNEGKWLVELGRVVENIKILMEGIEFRSMAAEYRKNLSDTEDKQKLRISFTEKVSLYILET